MPYLLPYILSQWTKAHYEQTPRERGRLGTRAEINPGQHTPEQAQEKGAYHEQDEQSTRNFSERKTQNPCRRYRGNERGKEQSRKFICCTQEFSSIVN